MTQLILSILFFKELNYKMFIQINVGEINIIISKTYYTLLLKVE